ncbi:activated D-alanine transport protein [Streptococcus porcinus]|uniref:D-alanyl-lipoteichoic acid biosynthesis protein DltB n=1 Tax=Streptococcus porcinus TaxID=1340 RepID=UPI0010CABF20|nr:D-alanyl-lipoteichoic acid biosynthesis protein DltB [Streptococcus porcinus]VTS22468.1 activated D-alanine transport protein [Streptococcus porcinus]
MIGVLEKIPYLDPYSNPIYFVYLILALLPIIIGLFYRRRLPLYEFLVTVAFILMMFGQDHTSQLKAFLIYVVWQTVCVFSYKWYRKRKDHFIVFALTLLLIILPLFFVKLSPFNLAHPNQSLFSFLGISYLTFKSVGMIMEMRDGILKEFTFREFLRFLIFLPTFSSGPIDRFRRFQEDYQNLPDKEQYLQMINKSVMYIMLGFLYKFIISYYLGSVSLPIVEAKTIATGGPFNIYLILVMYLYGLNLFFDFAGYSMFAIAISNLMGIKTPENFHLPFLAPNLKEFWNRWHMTLSFWFRDFVFMRLVHFLIKHKVFKNRNVTSGFAYLVNMTIMGFWHGITWYYVAYGVFHGTGLIITDAWIRKKKTINRNRKQKGLAPLFTSKAYHYLSIAVTFHIVMISLLLFSGFLDRFWIHPMRY